jgi:tetratricopeptide (TPR) repeat protein
LEEFFENELVTKFEEMIENSEELYFDTEEYEDIIIYYLEMGDISFAETAVRYALNLHPDSLEIKIKKFEVLLELENYTLAKELMDELKESSMESTDFLVCCAKYYSNLGNPRRAIEYCEAALKLEEEENFLHNFMADEYVNLEDPFTALKHYQLALSFEHNDDYALENIMVCYNSLHRGEDAIDFLNDYLDKFSFSETGWLEYGQFYFNRKNYEEAIKGFDYLLAINSQSVGVYANKAACYEAMGEWLKAVEVYEEMLALEYTKSFTFYKIGLCYKENKQPVLALNAFQKSLRDDPQFYLSMIEQSYIYEEMGSVKEAIHFTKEAVLLNNINLEYHKRLAFLYIASGNIEESVACIKMVVDFEPSRFYNWYAYSEVLMVTGDYEGAVEALKKATKMHNRAELFYQLSNCYFHLNNQKDGRKALAVALELDPNLLEGMKQKYPFIKEEAEKVKTKKK